MRFSAVDQFSCLLSVHLLFIQCETALFYLHRIDSSWYKDQIIQIRVSFYPWTYSFARLPQRHHHSFQSIKAVDQTLSTVWHRLTVCLLGVGSDNSVNENQLIGGVGHGNILPRLFYMTATPTDSHKLSREIKSGFTITQTPAEAWTDIRYLGPCIQKQTM